MRFRPWMPDSRLAWGLAVTLAWSLVALAQALQGYLVAAYRGEPQAWWPSLGYAAAIHSIWVIMTWPIVAATIAIERGITRWWLRLAAYLTLWPVVAALHVLLFGAFYWPIYRNEQIASRWEMADVMFVRNFDTNSIFYLVLVGLTIIGLRWPRRAVATVRPASPDADALVIRNRGSVRRIPFDAIDWIGAAGDYAEVHGEGRVDLIEEPLASLARRLPAGAFARIHRGALIRIDRVREIEPIGRGDAYVQLTTGEQLRLSRRFRDGLAALLGTEPPAQPAE
jgi:two-component system, LytTR family, response regulator